MRKSSFQSVNEDWLNLNESESHAVQYRIKNWRIMQWWSIGAAILLSWKRSS